MRGSSWRRMCRLVPAICAVTALTALAAATPCHAAGYHVAGGNASCSDAGPGSAAQPWCTIEHATEQATAGDTVWLHTAVYNEQLVTSASGSAGAGHIVFAAHPGDTPVIDGTGVTTGNNGVLIGHDYIKLIGLEVRNWNDNAVWVEGAGFIEISDCKVHDVRYGVGFFDGAHDFVLNRVEAYAFDLYGFDVSYESTPCFNGTFNDCVARNARDAQQNVDGFALGHGEQHDFTLNRCTTYDVYDGFDISARNTTVNRGASYACWNACYKLWADNVAVVNSLGWDSAGAIVELDWDQVPGTTFLTNCTFMDAEVFTVWVENAGDSLQMTNCILAGGDNSGLTFEQRSVANYTGNHNVFHNDNAARAVVVGYEDEFTLTDVSGGAWATYSGQDAQSLVEVDASALFVDPAAYDLHLTSGAVAIDAGSATGAPSEDYSGDLRPQGSGYDIGAYEYSAAAPTYPYTYWLEIAAHLPGKLGSLWVTDFAAFNEASSSANLQLVLHGADGDHSSTASIAAGAQGVFEDVVGTLVSQGKGTLEVRSNQPLRGVARTFNNATEGTFGQGFQLYTTDQGLKTGETAWLLQLRQEQGRFRTNISVANTGTVNARVRVRLMATDGTEVASYVLEPEPGQLIQDLEPFKERAGRPNLGWGMARIEVIAGTGVLASASVVDSGSNDGTTIVAVK